MANSYIYSGLWVCGVRRSNGGTAWTGNSNQTANGGSGVAALTMNWSNNVLQAITAGAWMGWTINVKLTMINADATINV